MLPWLTRGAFDVSLKLIDDRGQCGKKRIDTRAYHHMTLFTGRWRWRRRSEVVRVEGRQLVRQQAVEHPSVFEDAAEVSINSPCPLNFLKQRHVIARN